MKTGKDADSAGDASVLPKKTALCAEKEKASVLAGSSSSSWTDAGESERSSSSGELSFSSGFSRGNSDSVCVVGMPEVTESTKPSGAIEVSDLLRDVSRASHHNNDTQSKTSFLSLLKEAKHTDSAARAGDPQIQYTTVVSVKHDHREEGEGCAHGAASAALRNATGSALPPPEKKDHGSYGHTGEKQTAELVVVMEGEKEKKEQSELAVVIENEGGKKQDTVASMSGNWTAPSSQRRTSGQKTWNSTNSTNSSKNNSRKSSSTTERNASVDVDVPGTEQTLQTRSRSLSPLYGAAAGGYPSLREAALAVPSKRLSFSAVAAAAATSSTVSSSGTTSSTNNNKGNAWQQRPSTSPHTITTGATALGLSARPTAARVESAQEDTAEKISFTREKEGLAAVSVADTIDTHLASQPAGTYKGGKGRISFLHTTGIEEMKNTTSSCRESNSSSTFVDGLPPSTRNAPFTLHPAVAAAASLLASPAQGYSSRLQLSQTSRLPDPLLLLLPSPGASPNAVSPISLLPSAADAAGDTAALQGFTTATGAAAETHQLGTSTAAGGTTTRSEAPRLGDGGNWRCDACGNINYPRRTACNRCRQTRSRENDLYVAEYQRLKGELQQLGLDPVTASHAAAAQQQAAAAANQQQQQSHRVFRHQQHQHHCVTDGMTHALGALQKQQQHAKQQISEQQQTGTGISANTRQRHRPQQQQQEQQRGGGMRQGGGRSVAALMGKEEDISTARKPLGTQQLNSTNRIQSSHAHTGEAEEELGLISRGDPTHVTKNVGADAAAAIVKTSNIETAISHAAEKKEENLSGTSAESVGEAPHIGVGSPPPQNAASVGTLPSMTTTPKELFVRRVGVAPADLFTPGEQYLRRTSGEGGVRLHEPTERQQQQLQQQQQLHQLQQLQLQTRTLLSLGLVQEETIVSANINNMQRSMVPHEEQQQQQLQDRQGHQQDDERISPANSNEGKGDLRPDAAFPKSALLRQPSLTFNSSNLYFPIYNTSLGQEQQISHSVVVGQQQPTVPEGQQQQQQLGKQHQIGQQQQTALFSSVSSLKSVAYNEISPSLNDLSCNNDDGGTAVATTPASLEALAETGAVNAGHTSLHSEEEEEKAEIGAAAAKAAAAAETAAAQTAAAQTASIQTAATSAASAPSTAAAGAGVPATLLLSALSGVESQQETAADVADVADPVAAIPQQPAAEAVFVTTPTSKAAALLPSVSGNTETGAAAAARTGAMDAVTAVLPAFVQANGVHTPTTAIAAAGMFAAADVQSAEVSDPCHTGATTQTVVEEATAAAAGDLSVDNAASLCSSVEFYSDLLALSYGVTSPVGRAFFSSNPASAVIPGSAAANTAATIAAAANTAATLAAAGGGGGASLLAAGSSEAAIATGRRGSDFGAAVLRADAEKLRDDNSSSTYAWGIMDGSSRSTGNENTYDYFPFLSLQSQSSNQHREVYEQQQQQQQFIVPSLQSSLSPMQQSLSFFCTSSPEHQQKKGQQSQQFAAIQQLPGLQQLQQLSALPRQQHQQQQKLTPNQLEGKEYHPPQEGNEQHQQQPSLSSLLQHSPAGDLQQQQLHLLGPRLIKTLHQQQPLHQQAPEGLHDIYASLSPQQRQDGCPPLQLMLLKAKEITEQLLSFFREDDEWKATQKTVDVLHTSLAMLGAANPFQLAHLEQRAAVAAAAIVPEERDGRTATATAECVSGGGGGEGRATKTAATPIAGGVNGRNSAKTTGQLAGYQPDCPPTAQSHTRESKKISSHGMLHKQTEDAYNIICQGGGSDWNKRTTPVSFSGASAYNTEGDRALIPPETSTHLFSQFQPPPSARDPNPTPAPIPFFFLHTNNNATSSSSATPSPSSLTPSGDTSFQSSSGGVNTPGMYPEVPSSSSSSSSIMIAPPTIPIYDREAREKINLRGIGGPHFAAPAMLAHPDEFKNPSSFLKIYGDPLCSNSNLLHTFSPNHTILAGGGGGGPATVAATGGNVTYTSSNLNNSSCTPVRNHLGNWVCHACHNVNFPRRFRCNKCNELRNEEGDRIVADYAKLVHYHHLQAYKQFAAAAAGNAASLYGKKGFPPAATAVAPGGGGNSSPPHNNAAATSGGPIATAKTTTAGTATAATFRTHGCAGAEKACDITSTALTNGQDSVANPITVVGGGRRGHAHTDFSAGAAGGVATAAAASAAGGGEAARYTTPPAGECTESTTAGENGRYSTAARAGSGARGCAVQRENSSVLDVSGATGADHNLHHTIAISAGAGGGAEREGGYKHMRLQMHTSNHNTGKELSGGTTTISITPTATTSYRRHINTALSAANAPPPPPPPLHATRREGEEGRHICNCNSSSNHSSTNSSSGSRDATKGGYSRSNNNTAATGATSTGDLYLNHGNINNSTRAAGRRLGQVSAIRTAILTKHRNCSSVHHIEKQENNTTATGDAAAGGAVGRTYSGAASAQHLMNGNGCNDTDTHSPSTDKTSSVVAPPDYKNTTGGERGEDRECEGVITTAAPNKVSAAVANTTTGLAVCAGGIGGTTTSRVNGKGNQEGEKNQRRNTTIAKEHVAPNGKGGKGDRRRPPPPAAATLPTCVHQSPAGQRNGTAPKTSRGAAGPTAEATDPLQPKCKRLF